MFGFHSKHPLYLGIGLAVILIGFVLTLQVIQSVDIAADQKAQLATLEGVEKAQKHEEIAQTYAAGEQYEQASEQYLLAAEIYNAEGLDFDYIRTTSSSSAMLALRDQPDQVNVRKGTVNEDGFVEYNPDYVPEPEEAL
jgi:hypothetical protein